MRKKANKFSISKARRRAILVASIALGVTVGGFGIKTALDTKGDVSAVVNMNLLSKKMVDINPLYEQYLEDLENGEGDKWTLVPNKYIPAAKEDEGANNSLRSLGKKTVGDSGESSEINLPEQYNLREEGFATPLKDQGAEGLCWAFATTTAMESYLKKTQNLNVEFSPKQLDYMLWNMGSTGGYVNSALGLTHELGDGANFSLAGVILGTTGEAPVYEEAFFARLKAKDTDLANFQSWSQYSDWNRMLLKLRFPVSPYQKEMSKDDITADSSDYIVTSYTDYRASSGIIDKVKEHVYNKGAVEIGTFLSFEPNCFDAATKTIVDRGDSICDPEHEAGHAMSVVGWDDNYEYTDPATNETKTGALILQNSWGPSSLFHDFGFESVDDVIERFDLTVDSFSATETETKEEIFNKWKKYVQDLLGENGYDAPEVVYYAYDFTSEESSVDFGMIEEMVENDYDEIYSPSIATNFEGNELASEQRSGSAVFKYDDIFKFSTGGEEKIVDTIAVGTGLSFPFDSKISVAIGNGIKYIELGEIDFENSASGQKTINLQQPISVNGDFDIKINLCAVDSGWCEEYQLYQDVDGDEIIEERTLVNGKYYPDFDYKDDFYVVAYLKDEAEDSAELSKLLRGTKEITWISTTKEKYTIGDGKDLTFSIDYDYSYFDSIKIDNQTLESKNYKVESGSTKITIFHDYLDTLTAGKHSIKVAFKDGESVDLEFNVIPRTNTGGEDQGGNEGGNQGGNEGGNQGGGTGTVADAPKTSAAETDKKNTGTSNTGRFTAETKERAELTIIFTLPVAVVLFGIFRFSRLKK